MMKVGIVSVSDTRKSVHESLKGYIKECENQIREKLEESGDIEVIPGKDIVSSPEAAVKIGRQMESFDVCCIIANIAIFSFPNLTLNTLKQCSVPYLVWTIKNPQIPGMVGLNANVGYLHQNGIACEKVWGSIDDQNTVSTVMSFARAAYAVKMLRGQVYGLIGGRSIGMGTGAVNPVAWMKYFGVDVDHVDQIEIIRRANNVPNENVQKAFLWLENKVGKIEYDNDKLTTETLQEQIRYYYAMKSIVDENQYAFIGVKCHYELSAHYQTPCLAVALMNDPYDFDGDKSPLCCACEADSDGALSMHILRLISAQSSFLADTRHLDDNGKIFTFCNCGSIPTWYAGKSGNPETNLKKVSLYPIIPKYKGKGCHVGFIVEEGEMTFARLTYYFGHYRMVIFQGNCIKVPKEKLQETTPQWPHAFVDLKCNAHRLIQEYESNHVHGVYGNYVEELRQFCKMTGVECVIVS
jgi:L-fucose isomerase